MGAGIEKGTIGSGALLRHIPPFLSYPELHDTVCRLISRERDEKRERGEYKYSTHRI